MKCKNLVACLGLAIFIANCGDKKQEKPIVEEIIQTTQEDTIAVAEKDSVQEAIDKETVKKVKGFLLAYLSDDLKIMEENDRKFEIANVDLNHDGTSETFVRFGSGYFCGSGGCTFLLLNNKQKLINRFTVTIPPIFVEKKVENGWSVLLVKSGDEFKELVFDGKKYPSNPSVLPKAAYDVPSSNALALFDKPIYEAEMISF